MTAPIDPTSTSAWAELLAHRDSFTPDLRGWFAGDAGRVRRLSFPLGDLHVDLSKNLVTDEILASLVKLAEQTGVAEHYAAVLARRRGGAATLPPGRPNAAQADRCAEDG